MQAAEIGGVGCSEIPDDAPPTLIEEGKDSPLASRMVCCVLVKIVVAGEGGKNEVRQQTLIN